MLRFLADENLEFQLTAALRRDPAIDIVTVREAGLLQTPDPVILEWAAREERTVLTHDARTMVRDAYERSRTGLPTTGVIVVPRPFSVAKATEEIHQLAYANPTTELQGIVVYVRGR